MDVTYDIWDPSVFGTNEPCVLFASCRYHNNEYASQPLGCDCSDGYLRGKGKYTIPSGVIFLLSLFLRAPHCIA